MDVGNSSRFTFTIKGVEDTLRVVRFEGQEGISRPYVFTIDTVCENFDLDLDAVLQQPGQLIIHGPDGPQYVNGIIHANEILDPIGRFCRSRFELTPKVSLLHYRVNLKIFQHLTADAIIRQVLENAGLTTDDFKFQITGELPTRVYCTQYQESDLDFIHRLMAEDGLHYFIEQTNNNCVMVISDSHYSFKPVPIKPELEYKYQAGMETTDYFIGQFYITAEAQPNTVVFHDFNFEHPRLDLEVKESMDDDQSGLSGFEVYQHNVSYQNPQAGKQKAQHLIKAYQAVKLTGSGFTNCPYLSAGHFFKLNNYDDPRYEYQWLLTGVIHNASQPQVLEEHGTGRGSHYSNQIFATPRDHQFKTQPLAPKPTIRGNQYISIDQDSHTTIGDSLHSKTGSQYMIQAGNEIHIKAGDKVVIDASVELTLKGGGSFAKLDPSGVALQGTTIKINEGGNAGSGSGVSIIEPSQAAKADKNQPGQKFEPIPPQAKNSAKQLAFGQLNTSENTINQQDTQTVELALEDEEGNPIPLVEYEVTFENGSKRQGMLDKNGQAKLENVPAGHFIVTYPNQDNARNKGLAVKLNQAIAKNNINQVRGILSQPYLQVQGVANAYQLLFNKALVSAVKQATNNAEEALYVSHLLSRAKLTTDEAAELIPWKPVTGDFDE